LREFKISIKLISSNNSFIRILKIRNFIKNSNPYAVISFLDVPNLISILSGIPSRKWKLIIGERSANPSIIKSYRHKLLRSFHFLADYIVANSLDNINLLKKVLKFVPNNKFRVIYNIVNLNGILLTHKEKNEKLNIVIAASYTPVKNLTNLIKAVHNLEVKYQNQLRINWFGNRNIDPDYFNYNYDLIKKNNLSEIIFLNNSTNNIESEFLKSDFVGLFSFHEGFPNALCEAMLIGKPIICTSISDVPLFIKDKQNGFLCTPDNIDSIKFALMRSIDSTFADRASMGKKNIILAKSNFEEKKIVQQYLDLIND